MDLSRRDFMRAAAAIFAAPGLGVQAALSLRQGLRGEGHAPVVWLQGLGCNGDSVSLLNSIYYATIDNLLLNTIDLEYHPTVMAAPGDLAVTAAEDARLAGGYVLVIEGAIPTAESGEFCTIWEGMTMENAVVTYAPNASFILAVGTCAAYGGTSAGAPNPTSSVGVAGLLGPQDKIINIPGCPAHPDWIVGTIAHLLAHGRAPSLDEHRRPRPFFARRIHDWCAERREYCGEEQEADRLGQLGCLEDVGCKGKRTYADCYMRKFNGGQEGRFGVNWCIGARSPCHGCVEPDFPDGMSPFFAEDDD